MIGTTLSHYRIQDKLGQGGMGIVYKAEDTKLDRIVAIKVLPASALASDDDRARFYREAKAAASLHHPNIATVFEIDEAVPSDAPHGTPPSPFIAMEFIDGKPLDVRVEEGPLELQEAVRLTMQIAQALETAHEKNIVHRDIKAANVMLTKKGEAKVLDFGLAKTAHSTMLTRLGSTMGTVAYMSPEQARGDEVDGRTDLWALGVVLYQLISGRLPFGGDYEQAVTYSIINEDPPPLTGIRTGVPMGLEWIVTKLLAKKADDRYQSAKDLIVDLRTVDLTQAGLSRTTSVKSMPAAASSPPTKSNPLDLRGRLHPALIVLFVLMGVALGWWLSRPPATEAPLSQQFEIRLDEIRNPVYVEASPDGRLLVIMGQDSTLSSYFTFLYDTTTDNLRILNQNTGDRYFFSPDGTELAYRQGIYIYKVSVLGGNPIEVGRFGSGWPAWTPDGDLLFDWNESLWLHPADGSEPTQISQVDSLAGEGGHYNAEVFPGGKHAIMHVTRTTGEVRQLAVLDLESGEHRSIGNGASASYLESGHLIYIDGSASAQGQMLIRPFDLDRLDWAGPPAIVEEDGAIGQWAFDQNRTAYYLNRPANVGAIAGQIFRFVLIDPLSRNEAPFDAPEDAVEVNVSPDGGTLIIGIDASRSGAPDYYLLFDRDTEVSQRIPLPSLPHDGRWSGDSKHVYIGMGRDIQKWSMETLGVADSWEAEGYPSTLDVDEDGRFAVYVNHINGDWARIRHLDLDTGEDKVLAEGMFLAPRLSPDGAYLIALDLQLNLQVISVETGSLQPLSPNGEPVSSWEWAENGYIYYQTNSEIRRVPVATDPTFRVVGQPEIISDLAGLATFHVDAEGRIIALINNFYIGDQQRNSPTDVTIFTHFDHRAHEMAPWAED